MQQHSDHPNDQHTARAMYILGQIGAIVCHEGGPKTDRSILTHMATHPAEGFWLAVSGIETAASPLRGRGRTLSSWKRREVARLGRMLPHPLPASASAQTQMPFWAGYCRYWSDALKTHVLPETQDSRQSANDEPHRLFSA